MHCDHVECVRNVAEIVMRLSLKAKTQREFETLLEEEAMRVVNLTLEQNASTIDAIRMGIVFSIDAMSILERIKTLVTLPKDKLKEMADSIIQSNTK